ncbi:MAG: Rid family detoxifying hydrolase [Flavobacteriales bacterium AspAUS03]
MKKILSSPQAPQTIGPYSQAVWINNFLYISGQIPIDPQTNQVITQGIEAETRQVLHNIQAILLEAKMNFENIIKTSIFIKNMDNLTTVNIIYSDYFKTVNYPARETIEVSRLPKEVNIEISIIAHK